MKTIYLNDAKLEYEAAQNYFINADLWAKCQCRSYMGFHVQDVSDVSYIYDHIAEYRFKDPQDAFVFQLKYSN